MSKRGEGKARWFGAYADVIYGVDVGVYLHGKRAQVIRPTSFAWARLDAPAALLAKQVKGKATFQIDKDVPTGSDIRVLAGLLSRDLHERRRVALGIEAPMWQPAPTEVATEAFQLFGPRFSEERGSEWYLQSGAAALAKAITLGRLIFSLCDFKKSKVISSCDHNDPCDLVLYEGFVAGDWKLGPGRQNGHSDHQWDAISTAIAYQRYLANMRGKRATDVSLLHKPHSVETPVISHWKTILESAGMPNHLVRRDCAVVGFNWKSQKFLDSLRIRSKRVASESALALR